MAIGVLGVSFEELEATREHKRNARGDLKRNLFNRCSGSVKSVLN